MNVMRYKCFSFEKIYYILMCKEIAFPWSPNISSKKKLFLEEINLN